MNPTCTYHRFYSTSNPPADYSALTRGELAETIEALTDENQLLRVALQQSICKTSLITNQIQEMVDRFQDSAGLPTRKETPSHGKK